jgi:MFS family permease
LTTVVAALSWRIEALLVARTVQAISGAAAIPNGTALVRCSFPPSDGAAPSATWELPSRSRRA